MWERAPYPIRPGSFRHGESGTRVVPTEGAGINEIVDFARRYRESCIITPWYGFVPANGSVVTQRHILRIPHVTVMVTWDWRRYAPRGTITKAIDMNLHRDRNMCTMEKGKEIHHVNVPIDGATSTYPSTSFPRPLTVPHHVLRRVK